MYNKQLLQIFEQTPINKRKSKRISNFTTA